MKSIADLVGGMFGGRKPKEAPEGGELSEQVEKWVSEKWQNLKNSYIIYHQNQWAARLFYAGVLWIDLDPANRKFWVPVQPADDWVPQPKINEFAPAIDAICSNFASVPEVEAVPVPEDDEQGMVVAGIINELTDHCIKDNALRSDYQSDEDKAGYAAQEFVLSGCVFTNVYPEDEIIGKRPITQPGTGYAYQCLNCDTYEQTPEPIPQCPQCGQPVEVSQVPTEEPVLDEAGQPQLEDVKQKKIVVRFGDAGHCYPRPGARNMSETPYIIWAQRFTLDEIWYRWNYKAEADNEWPDGYNLQWEHSLNYYYTGYNTSASQVKDACLVIQVYVEPQKLKDFPDGFYAVMCNQKVIHAVPWAEAFVEHPLTKGDYVQLPTLFFPRSVAFDLVELQRELNSYESLIKLHAMTSAVDSIIIDENTVVTEPTGRADKIIKWRSIGPGSKEPHRMQHGTLDSGVYEQRQHLEDKFQTISAAVSVFRGEQPGSVTAASAIAQLRGQAELQFSRPVQNWNNLWKETVRKVIKNYQRHYTVPQLVAILGEDKVSEIEAFLACDLDNKIEFIATSTGLPRTRDEKRQEMMVLYDKGALDPNDPNVRQKLFELFGETGLMQSFNADARRARMNINKVKRGEPAIFRAGIDDPAVHLGIALEAAKSLDFERWPPPAQQGLIAYIDDVRQVQSMLAAPPMPAPGGLEEGGQPTQEEGGAGTPPIEPQPPEAPSMAPGAPPVGGGM